jgi:LacI family transcriptional regulator
MDGHPPADLRVRTAAGPVVVRGSTDLLAGDDQEAAAAIAFVRAHACQRLKVADVARHVGLSPAVLQARVRKALGRTVHQELQRVQVEQVKELLSDSDLSMKQIARRCGFRYTQYMSRVFREATGQTLTEYRKQKRM